MQFCANDQKWFMRRKYAEIDIEVSERWSEQKKSSMKEKIFPSHGRNSSKNSVTADQLKFKSMNRSSRIVTSCDFAPFLNQ